MKEQSDDAIAEYNRAIELKRDWADPYTCRGTAYLDIGQFERAILDFDKSLQLAPNDAGVLMERAIAYQGVGEDRKALADFNAAIRKDAALGYAHYDRGCLLTKLGDYDKALIDLNEAVRRNPQHPSMYAARAKVYREQKMIDRALADYRTAEHASGRGYCRAFVSGKRVLPPRRLCASGRRLSPSENSAARPGDSGRDGRVVSSDLSRRVVPQWHRSGASSETRAPAPTGWKDGDCIAGLAAGYAEVGEFDAALEYQAQAIKLRGRSSDREMEEHLSCYQERRPYRQEPLH